MVDRRLRVLVTTSTFPVWPGDGTPRFIYDLAQALTVHADVTVLAPDAPGASPIQQEGDLEIRRFAYFRPRALQRLVGGDGIPDNLRRSWLAKAQVPGFMLAQRAALRRVAREKRVDVINAHWLVPQGLVATWALPAGHGPALVVHGHGGDAYLLRDLPFGRAIAKRVIRRADGLLLSGSGVRDVLSRLVGHEVDAMLQPMGVDLRLFGRAADGCAPGVVDPALRGDFSDGYLLFVGRMIEIKGAVYAIRALQRIRAAHPNLGLVLIGDGPERGKLEAEARRLGLENAVRFLGRLPHDHIAAYLQDCSAVVVPSITDSTGRAEGMPTVIVEAMAAGAKVVATASGGIPDVVVDGENGWLVGEKDLNGLAERVLIALDESRSSRFDAAVASTARAFAWEAVASRYADCLKEAKNARR